MTGYALPGAVLVGDDRTFGRRFGKPIIRRKRHVIPSLKSDLLGNATERTAVPDLADTILDIPKGEGSSLSYCTAWPRRP